MRPFRAFHLVDLLGPVSPGVVSGSALSLRHTRSGEFRASVASFPAHVLPRARRHHHVSGRELSSDESSTDNRDVLQILSEAHGPVGHSLRYYPKTVTFPSWEVRVYRGFGARVGRAIRSPRGLVSPKPPGFGKIPAGAATASQKVGLSQNSYLPFTHRKYKARQATMNPGKLS